MARDDYEVPDAITNLSNEYKQDLNVIRNILRDDVTTPPEVMRATIIAMKYGYTSDNIRKMNTKNLYLHLGKIEKLILDRLETLVKQDILERLREETPGRMPKKSKTEKSDDPEKGWE